MKNSWVNLRSQEVYVNYRAHFYESRRLELQPIKEDMTEDRRFELLLGLERSGYIHDYKAGPKHVTSSLQKQINKKLKKENEELKRKA